MVPRRSIIVVVGKTGMGKTLWAIAEVRSRHRVLILDPSVDDPYPATVVDHVEDVLPAIEEKRVFRIMTDRVDQVDDLAAIAFTLGRTTLVLDEAQTYLDPRMDLKREIPSLREIIFRGRHNCTSLIIVAQRAASIHVDARSQWTRLVIFNQTEHDDVKWLQQQSGQALPIESLSENEYFDVTRAGSITRRTLDESFTMKGTGT